MKKYFISLCFIVIFSNIHAQYQLADTNYINTSILINLKNDSLFLANIKKYQLDINHVFYFPKDSIRNFSIGSTSNKYYSSPYVSSGKMSVGKAIATIISAPIIALGKILGGFSRLNAPPSSNSFNKGVQKDSVEKVVEVYPTTLMKELLDKDYYGRNALIYNTLTYQQTLDFEHLDTFPQFMVKEYANKIINLSIYISDTNLLSYLYANKHFYVNNTMTVDNSVLNKPLLYAAYTSDFKLLHFLINHQVNPFIKTTMYNKNIYSLGLNSGVYFPSKLDTNLDMYKEIDVIKLSKNKTFIKAVSQYRKVYKKNYMNKK